MTAVTSVTGTVTHLIYGMSAAVKNRHKYFFYVDLLSKDKNDFWLSICAGLKTQHREKLVIIFFLLFFFYIPFFIWSFQYFKLLINFNTCICLKSIVIVLHLFCVTNALVKRFVLCVLTSSASFQSAKTQTWISMCNDVCHLGTAHYFFYTFWMPCSETDISFSFYVCRRVYFTGTQIYPS